MIALALLVLLWPATVLAADDATTGAVGGAGGVAGLLLALAGRWAWGRLFPSAPKGGDKETPIEHVARVPRLDAPSVQQRADIALAAGGDACVALVRALAAEARAEVCASCVQLRAALAESQDMRIEELRTILPTLTTIDASVRAAALANGRAAEALEGIAKRPLNSAPPARTGGDDAARR